MNLAQLIHLFVGPRGTAVEDEQRVVAVVVELGPLTERTGVVKRKRVEAKQVPQLLHLRVVGSVEVEPEEAVLAQQLPDPLLVDRGEAGDLEGDTDGRVLDVQWFCLVERHVWAPLGTLARRAGAIGAEAVDADLGAMRREAGVGRSLHRAGQLDAAVEVLDLSAAVADHVIVRVGPRVVEDGALAHAQPADQAQLLEELERGVDGGRGHVGQPVRDARQHLLGGHVPVQFVQRAVDYQPLRGDPLPARVKNSAELGVAERC